MEIGRKILLTSFLCATNCGVFLNIHYFEILKLSWIDGSNHSSEMSVYINAFSFFVISINHQTPLHNILSESIWYNGNATVIDIQIERYASLFHVQTYFLRSLKDELECIRKNYDAPLSFSSWKIFFLANASCFSLFF